MLEKVAVIGAGSWATALAVLLGKKGHPVSLWARRAEQVTEVRETRQNHKYLPGVMLPNIITATNDLAEAVSGCDKIILGVPSHAVREICKQLQPILKTPKTVINTAKGLEESSLARLSTVMEEEFGGQHQVVVLSGPSHAEEVGRDLPTTVVVSTRQRMTAEAVQDLFMTPTFRVYTNPDLVGVELAGSLKNVIALCCGVADGLGLGDNTRAALMTRGLAEIARLGMALGAQPLTFAGLAGVGDLIVTCTSMHSRNRRAGIEIGKGKTMEEAVASVQMVVEGVRTTRSAWALAQRHQVSMPITEQAYRVLFEGANAKDAVTNLMLRGKAHEVEEVAESFERSVW